jgi:hypothetical protein
MAATNGSVRFGETEGVFCVSGFAVFDWDPNPEKVA